MVLDVSVLGLRAGSCVDFFGLSIEGKGSVLEVSV